MRSLLGFCLGVVFATSGFCSTIPTGITETVVFIYTNVDGAPNHADGTGFLVGVPVPSQPSRSWVYLVTAQHVLHTDANNLNSPLYPQLWARLNRKSGDSIIETIDICLSGKDQTVFLDSDTSVDVAVIPVSLAQSDQFDFRLLPEDMLVRPDDLKKYNIGVGCDMFFTGMFAPYQGQKNGVTLLFALETCDDPRRKDRVCEYSNGCLLSRDFFIRRE